MLWNIELLVEAKAYFLYLGGVGKVGSLLLIYNLDPMHSVDQEINKANVVPFRGLHVFLFLNIEGDLDFYVNKLIRFLVLFICVVAWDCFVRNTRSNFTKRSKSEVWVFFERYKFLEYLFCGKISLCLDHWHMTL